ncbi:MAG: MBL fold metallo-hydrolase [bacterium]
MKVKITTLMDNTARSNLVGEHGFAALVEANGERILFDAGQSSLTLWNATRLGIDLKGIEKIVLSHGHYDHTGGLPDILAATKGARVFAHPDIFNPKYHIDKDGKRRYVGVPHVRKFLEGLGADFSLSKEPITIGGGILTTGEVARDPEFESLGDGLWEEREGELVKDRLTDDQSLIVESDKGLVVILGCAHAGIVNILSQVSKTTGERKIHAVLGGMHLAGAKAEHIDDVIEALKGFDIDRIGISHCTGTLASIMLFNTFGDRVFFNNTGETLTVD